MQRAGTTKKECPYCQAAWGDINHHLTLGFRDSGLVVGCRCRCCHQPFDYIAPLPIKPELKGVSAARIGGMASYFYLMDEEELRFLQGGINGR